MLISGSIKNEYKTMLSIMYILNNNLEIHFGGPEHISKMDKIRNLIDGLPADWREIIMNPDSLVHLKKALNGLQPYAPKFEKLCPSIEDVFNAFKLTPYWETKVIIIGQDPYQTPGFAHGLCFSVQMDIKIPPSLNNIYKALMNTGVITRKPTHGCLQNWAAQGILMLNASLTTEIQKPGAHKFWHAWTDWLIKYLSDNRENLIFLLWGKDAQRRGEYVDPKKHYVFEWIHPSPMAQGVPDHLQFKVCDHFTSTSDIYEYLYGRTIDWNPTSTTFVYTDGSCPNNGTSRAKAGYGVYFQSGPLHKLKIASPLPKALYNGEEMKQTNIRAEMLAAIDALTVYAESGCIGDFIMIIDCEIVVKTINIWLKDWYRKNLIEKRKNPDLLWKLKSALDSVRSFQKEHGLTFKVEHIYSHVPKNNAPDKGTKEYKMWKGNNIVDVLAKEGVNLKEKIYRYN